MTPLYLLGSLAGIALLVVLNFVLFSRARPNVGNAEAIAARLRREVPGFRAGRCAVAQDGRSALIENAAERTAYFVEAMGDGVVMRKLSRDLLANVSRDGAQLSLSFADFTLGRTIMKLDGDDLAREWEARLKA